MSLDVILNVVQQEVGKRDDATVRDVLRATLAADQSSPTSKLAALKLSRAKAEHRIAEAEAEAARILASVAFDRRYLDMTEEVALDLLRGARWPKDGSYKDPSGVSLKATPTTACVPTQEDAVTLLSPEYVRVVPERREPDLNRIKSAILRGEPVEGFEVVHKVSEKVKWS